VPTSACAVSCSSPVTSTKRSACRPRWRESARSIVVFETAGRPTRRTAFLPTDVVEEQAKLSSPFDDFLGNVGRKFRGSLPAGWSGLRFRGQPLTCQGFHDCPDLQFPQRPLLAATGSHSGRPSQGHGHVPVGAVDVVDGGTQEGHEPTQTATNHAWPPRRQRPGLTASQDGGADRAAQVTQLRREELRRPIRHVQPGMHDLRDPVHEGRSEPVPQSAAENDRLQVE
jgi:hypothetical protein